MNPGAVEDSTSLRRTREAVDAVVVLLDGERHALLARDVREVIRAVALTRLPRPLPMVEGVIDLRGEIVPVLDVRSRLGMPAKPLEASDHFLIARLGARAVALRVDAATDLLPIDPAQVTAPPGGATHVRGVVKQPDGMVLLYDLPSFLTSAEEGEIDAALRELGFSEAATEEGRVRVARESEGERFV